MRVAEVFKSDKLSDSPDRPARNFMRVAEVFESVNFTDLDIQPSALYALASGTVPEAVRDEFVARAESGERVTHAMATPAP